MEKASQDLTLDHDNILVIMNVLEKICLSIKSTRKTDFNDLQQIIDLVRVFADKLHHAKEESIFYPALVEAGLKKEDIIFTAIMLEHEIGRELVREMQKSVSCNFIAMQKFLTSSRSFIDLQRQHIEKENTLLFPLADSLIPDEKQQQLIISFRNFEENIFGKVRYEEIYSMLRYFAKKYIQNAQV
jgi:hemerythrin-like domain-containing protein